MKSRVNMLESRHLCLGSRVVKIEFFNKCANFNSEYTIEVGVELFNTNL